MVHDQLAAQQLGAFDGGGFDLVAGRAALEPDQGFEPVAPVRGGGQAEPASRPGALHARLERDRRDVVALVDDDEAVVVEDGRVVAAGEALDHRDVDHSGRAVAAAADLADLRGVEVEVLGESGAPLVDEFLAVDDHQRRHLVVGDHRAGHHGLAGTRWGDEHAEVVARPGPRPRWPAGVAAFQSNPTSIGADVGPVVDRCRGGCRGSTSSCATRSVSPRGRWSHSRSSP